MASPWDQVPSTGHPRVFFFSSYLEASQLALQQHLISLEGWQRVRQAVESCNLVKLCRLHREARRFFGLDVLGCFWRVGEVIRLEACFKRMTPADRIATLGIGHLQ